MHGCNAMQDAVALRDGARTCSTAPVSVLTTHVSDVFMADF